MCQFIVQQIQYSLVQQMAGPDDGIDPNEILSDVKMRQINSRLTSRRGGKGIVRIVAEDTVWNLCNADNMPELFYSYCSEMQASFPGVIDAIYYQFSAPQVCQEEGFCPPLSYFYDNGAVHAPINSKIDNSGRGTCGFTGGAHQQAGMLTSALCFAAKLVMK